MARIDRTRTTPARRNDDVVAPTAPAADGAAAVGGATAPAPTAASNGAPAGHITGADIRPEFRISVRGVYAGPTPPPALMDDWFDAAVTAEAKHRAAKLTEPEAHKAVSDEQQRIGRDLTDDEAKQVYNAAFKAAFRPHFAAEYAEVSKSDSTKKKAVSTAKRREKKHLLARGRDPFTPLAQGDPQARAKEIMLYEDSDIMVVVDQFCPSPKALVVPKKQAMFPTDINKTLQKKLAKIGALVSDAFGDAAGSQHADIWINPPQRLSLSQLHVHVQPNLPRWESQRRPRGVPPPAALVKEQGEFYALVAKKLGALVAAS